MRLAAIFLLALPICAQSRESRAWQASVAAMVAGTTLDAASSWNRPELNPLLATDGRFGARGVAIKAGVTLGTVWLERRFLRNHPKLARPLSWINFSIAGMYGGVAARNWRLQ